MKRPLNVGWSCEDEGGFTSKLLVKIKIYGNYTFVRGFIVEMQKYH